MGDSEPIQCRAAVMYEEGKPLVIEDVIIDVPNEDQIRIKIVSAGICASDGHFVWGEQKIADFDGHSLPAVLGHEGAGIVESVGSNVTTLQPGDHVLTTFMAQCHDCPNCENPLTNLCAKDNLMSLGSVPNKKLLDGSPIYALAGLGVYSEYVLLKPSQVVKIDKKANLEHACIISCAVSTGFFSATHQAKVTPGSTCAVWGLGAIGINALYGCKFNGAKNIIGIDINSDKEQMAMDFGCTEFINPRELDKPLEQYLLEKYGGVDYALDCYGSQQIVDVALKSLSIFGTFAMVGLAPKGANIVYPTADLLVGRKIVGGFLGQKKTDQAYTELTDLYIKGEYDVDKMISLKFSLDEINAAFQTLKDGKCIRSLIIF